MTRHLKSLLRASLLIAGLAAAPTLYAYESHHPTTGPTMMNPGDPTGDDHTMGQMNEMMESCNAMMQGMMGDSQKPNEQWRDPPSPAD